jgi:hypothetical protein
VYTNNTEAIKIASKYPDENCALRLLFTAGFEEDCKWG